MDSTKYKRILPVLATTLAFTAGGASDRIANASDPERVFADAYNSTSGTTTLPIRGRLIRERASHLEDPNSTAWDEVSQDEIEDAVLSVHLLADAGPIDLGEIRTDDEGYFGKPLDIARYRLAPGRYPVEYSYQGEPVRTTQATLIGASPSQRIVRSDVDWTYLETDFQSGRAMLKLMDEPASAKQTLPAMDIVYSAIRGDAKVPVTFLSGSPRFFKRVLERKMQLDGVEQDGLVLKPFKDIVFKLLLTPSDIVPALKEQVGYKLSWLLRLRQQAPPETREVLMGDDTEADFIVYELYYRFMSGAWGKDRLLAELDKLGVDPLWRKEIAGLAPEVTTGATPLAIYINHTPVTGKTHDIADHRVPGVTRYHRGAWPLALDLWEEGLLSADAVRDVRACLQQRFAETQASLLDKAGEDFISTSTIQRFSDSMADRPLPPGKCKPPANKADT